jgi:L-ectoine synthase
MGVSAMFVRTLEDLHGSEKEMKLTDAEGELHSVRILTRDDGCGFSVSDVKVKGRRSLVLHYKNHVEANLVVGGQVELENLSNGEKWTLTPGMLYVVGPKDRHRMSTQGGAHIISVFSPAITGTERHDADGAFEPSGDIPPAWQGEAGRTMFVMSEDDAHKLMISGGRTPASRYLLLKDECGFTVSTPRGRAGNESNLWYKNHVEANYILDGEITLEEVATGQTWELSAGAIYLVGPNDRHKVKAKTDTYVLSVFNPPLQGDETHDADGSYPPSGDIPPAWRT